MPPTPTSSSSDGRLVWKLTNVDGLPLVNDNTNHGAQFSVSTRPNGYTRYGGDFNFLGFGHWFGHIGDIRISDVRRYSEWIYAIHTPLLVTQKAAGSIALMRSEAPTS